VKYCRRNGFNSSSSGCFPPPIAAQAHREAAVQTWAAESGYAAPRVLAVLEADDGIGLPTQVMERAPGKAMIAAITSRPWQTRRRIHQLAALAAQLHALPTEGWPGPAEPLGVVEHRLSLPRRVVAERDVPDLAAALAAAEPLTPRTINDERVVCHGDFHPLNVVVDGASASVIDWTDAALGPREADVSRTALLFNVAVIAANSSVERAVLSRVGPRMGRRYLYAYEQHAPLDHDLLKLWEVFHALHGWAQLEMLRAGGFDGESSSTADSVDASVKDIVRGRFDAALAAVT
jgi:aminoglycoside phosphotransferase (APT) family kinase protein